MKPELLAVAFGAILSAKLACDRTAVQRDTAPLQSEEFSAWSRRFERCRFTFAYSAVGRPRLTATRTTSSTTCAAQLKRSWELALHLFQVEVKRLGVWIVFWDLRLVYNVMLVFACISSHKNLHCLERDGQSNLFGLPALKILRSTLTCEKSSP